MPSTIAQLISPVVIIALLWILVLIVENVVSADVYLSPLSGAVDTSITGVCTKWNKDSECFTLAYAHNNNEFAKKIMGDIKNDFDLGDKDIKAFTTEKEMEDFFVQNPNVTATALAFSAMTIAPDPTNANETINLTDYTVYYNSTGDATSYVLNVQTIVDETIIKLRMAEEGKTYKRSSIELKTMGYPNPPREMNGQIIILGQQGPLFFCLAAMTVLINSLNALVVEKENNIVFGMKVMGMKTAAYWISWAITFLVVAVVTTLLTIGVGAATQIYYFLQVNFFLNFAIFFFFTLSMISMAFLLSTLVNTGKAALILGFIVLAISFILNAILAQPIFVQLLFADEIPKVIPIILTFYPPFNFAKIFADMGKTAPVFDPKTRTYKAGESYTFHDAYQWTKVGGKEVVPPMAYTIWCLVGNSAIFLVVGWYLYNVLPQDSGIKQPPWFFILPSYWGIRFKKKHRIHGGLYASSREEIEEMDDDVRNAYDAARDSNRPNVALRIVGLQKTFGSLFGKSVRAVRELNLVVNEGQCVALLGHNGAGKSTTFNMITGMIRPGKGDIFVHDRSCKYEINEIRKRIGYCPQHDILLNEMTAKEHLEMFAVFKNIPFARMKEEVAQRLKDVSLFRVRNKLTQTFSGGMKRRLSVAISCIGDPNILLLDEPTTGMDAGSMREVWNLINSMKGGRVIVLTTHSMEEADALADNIALMAGGKLRCIGDSLTLKNKYGAGYNLTIVSQEGMVTQVQDLVNEHMGSAATLSTEDAGNMIFVIDPDYIATLAKFLRFLEDSMDQETGKLIKDWAISNTTLEEVYLKVTNDAGFELGGADHEEDIPELLEEEMDGINALHATDTGSPDAPGGPDGPDGPDAPDGPVSPDAPDF